MTSNKIRVLRVSPSFASKNVHGSGLNVYFHSKHADYPCLVLTEWKDDSYLEIPSPYASLVPLRTFSVGLGSPSDSSLLILKAWILKLAAVFIFFGKAIKPANEFRPDVVHLYTPIHLLVGLYCRLFFRSKVIISLHGTDVLRLRRSRFLRFMISWVDHLLLLSKKMSSDLSMLNIPMSYLGNGFDASVFKMDEKERRPWILNVGSLRWQKDHRTLIEAFAIFKHSHSSHKLVIVGSGELETELRDLVDKLGLTEAVDFRGTLPPSDVALLMQISDIFAISSISEGSPKVVLEAMASGLPVAATSIGDLPEMIHSGGVVSAVSDVASFAVCLEECAALARSVNRSHVARLVEHKSWENVAVVLVDRYRQIMGVK
ncbi:glycosyltransferase family 4 protein [Gammaproteobacteria bacterium]|nr:glycosyltransferase family 4 protein [Gammaproteobacteria bacterium]